MNPYAVLCTAALLLITIAVAGGLTLLQWNERRD